LATVNTNNPIITLTTDFGSSDNYAGIIRGIIAGINPLARIIDISHDVPDFNIAAGRYLIETSFINFPPGTIHVGIIDPTVGTKRRAILVETENYFFIGPDNGLFAFIENKAINKSISLTSKKYHMRDLSSTFHGRDIFAPVAAFLSLGVEPSQFGREIIPSGLNGIKGKTASKESKGAGHIIYIDHFGNLVTSLKNTDLPSGNFEVLVDSRPVGPVRKTFVRVKKGNPLCYINSFGYLEIGVNQGSAASLFNIDYSTNPKILIAST